MRNTILVGDCLDSMRKLPDGCVHCCVTSPPYYALRDYGHSGQIGLEGSPEAYIAKLVEVFREVRRILRDDGTLWLNLGDSYAAGKSGRTDTESRAILDGSIRVIQRKAPAGYKSKDLLGIPWRVALALQADGWYLRSDIIWHKPNPMPESVRDRPTKAHEYLFLLTKSPRYFYDALAIREDNSPTGMPFGACNPSKTAAAQAEVGGQHGITSAISRRLTYTERIAYATNGRNRRSVWRIPTHSYRGAHFATFPPRLIEPCILAGTSAKGVCDQCGAPWQRVTEKTRLKRQRGNDFVKRSPDDTAQNGNVCPNTVAGVVVETLGWNPSCKCGGDIVPAIVFDPFGGSGTTGQVARSHGRDYLLCELNPAYVELAEKRIATPLTRKGRKRAAVSANQKVLFIDA